MKRIRMHRLAVGAVLLSCAPAFAQFGGPSTSAISRVNGNTAVTGVTIGDSALATDTGTAAAQARSDQVLMSDLVTALATNPAMNGARIEVQVSGGRVTLGGVVQSVAQYNDARAIADSVAGSANVTNRLTTGG